MKRSILGLLFTAVALQGCGSEPPARQQPPPVIVEKIVDGQPVKFAMLDGAEGKKVFFRLDDGYNCTSEGCTSCADGSCILNGGCPCGQKACVDICLPQVVLPVPSDQAALLALPRAKIEETYQKKVVDLEKRLNDLERRVNDAKNNP
jgi:hypothetical protein